jgi:hypothetical protein
MDAMFWIWCQLMLIGCPSSEALQRRHGNRFFDTRIVLRNVATAAANYFSDGGLPGHEHDPRCPTLAQLVEWRYLSRLPADGWERPLHEVCPGGHYPFTVDYVSAGGDGQLGTADDIHSWDP